MESGLTMLMHAVLIGAVLFVVMRFVFGQPRSIAENRSIVLAAAALIYMILFGHGLPRRINW